MNIDVRLLVLTALLWYFGAASAQNVSDEADIEELTDEDLRQNPVFEADSFGVGLGSQEVYLSYPFLNKEANRIVLNGADWSKLQNLFAECDERPVNIVHIGDSHIQADMSTSMVRRLLQDKYGAEGRGLVVPLRLAGTNEPVDYSITTDVDYTANKLLRYPWDGNMGFTGVSITPNSKTFNITISAHEPFERIRVFYGGSPLYVEEIFYQESNLIYTTSDIQSQLEIGLPFPCEEVTLKLSTLGSADIYGMELCGDIIGVAYHAIGINGATCESYNRIDDFGRQIAMLQPGLIVISLGTNEAFGRFNASVFEAQLDCLVKELKKGNPDASLLLVTPAECQRRIRRGRKRRSVSYTVNPNIASTADVIRDYGKSHGIAVYDWYEAAGGDGASAKWLSSGLLSRDRVHYTHHGYELAGIMLYEALVNIIQIQTVNSDDIQ